MRRFLLATTLFLAATSAHAATISIGYELPSFTPTVITMVGHEVNPVFGTKHPKYRLEADFRNDQIPTPAQFR